MKLKFKIPLCVVVLLLCIIIYKQVKYGSSVGYTEDRHSKVAYQQAQLALSKAFVAVVAALKPHDRPLQNVVGEQIVTEHLRDDNRSRDGMGTLEASERKLAKVLDFKYEEEFHENDTSEWRQSGAVHLALVACERDSRFEEAMVALTSAVTWSETFIHLHIFTDSKLRPKFESRLGQWPAIDRVRSRVALHLHRIQYPPEVDTKIWITLFRKCSSQRLFLPLILPDVDAVLYVDTDVVFLTSPHHLWRHLSSYTPNQIASLAPEHEDPTVGWYNRNANIPYVPPLGVNSGVMLMNLTRMRQVQWMEHITQYFNEFHKNITYGDQDLINIYFHYFPDKLQIIGCPWNYRSDHCQYTNNCAAAEKEGIHILHGNRKIFHNDIQPVFKTVYDAIAEHRLDADPKTMVHKLTAQLEAHQERACGHVLKRLLFKTPQNGVVEG